MHENGSLHGIQEQLHAKPTNMYKYGVKVNNTSYGILFSAFSVFCFSLYLSTSWPYALVCFVLLYLSVTVSSPSIPKPHHSRFYRENKLTTKSHATTSTWKWESLVYLCYLICYESLPATTGSTFCVCVCTKWNTEYSQSKREHRKHDTRFYVETRIGKTTGGPQTP